MIYVIERIFQNTLAPFASQTRPELWGGRGAVVLSVLVFVLIMYIA